MRKRVWQTFTIGVGVVSVAAAAAILGTDPGTAGASDLVQVVDQATGINVASLPGSPGVPAAGSDTSVVPPGVTLSDIIYFGTCWWQFQTDPNTMPPLVIGNGYQNPQVTYDSDGNYFAGTIEKVDGQGRLTDVILAFAAAKTGSGLNALGDVRCGSRRRATCPGPSSRANGAMCASSPPT